MSDRALAAAIRPKSKGESTTGVKKSIVETIVSASRSAASPRRKTAASSDESKPTRARGSETRGREVSSFLRSD
jgi:hypothetical protein